MKVCVYLEAEDIVTRSGFKRAFEQQKRALAQAGVKVTTDPASNYDYDLLHLHLFGPKSFYYLKRAQAKGIKVIVHAHSIGAYDFQNSFTLSNLIAPWYQRYLNFFYRQADHIFTPSEYAKGILESHGLKNISVVSNGIDRDKFRFSLEKRLYWRERLNLKRFAIFSAGNVLPRKGVIDFIEVARQLPHFDFVWCGHRWNKLLSFHPQMHREIQGRPANVQLPGFIADMPGVLSAADAFFFPSYGESQGLVLLEASSIGLPLVVRDLPAYRGWLMDGQNCLKGQSKEDFIKQLLRLARDQALLQRLSRGALTLAAEHDLKWVAERLKRLYILVLNGSSPARLL